MDRPTHQAVPVWWYDEAKARSAYEEIDHPQATCRARGARRFHASFRLAAMPGDVG